MTIQRRNARPHRLSVVIPATDSVALEETLVSVLENRPESCDVVVALGTAYDDPWNIRDEVCFVDAPRGSGLVGCVNAGIAASTGDVIHVLAGGWRATAGWTDRALEHFDVAGVGAVVPLVVTDADGMRPVSAGIRRTRGGRSVAVTLPRGDIVKAAAPSAPALEAGFWRADILAGGGFSTACGDSCAAADMAATLAAAGLDVAVEPECRVVMGPAVPGPGSFAAGLAAERLFWRSLACERTLPALLAHAGEVARHAVAAAPLGTLPMLAGRLTALVQFGSCMGRARQLSGLKRDAARREAEGDAAARTYRIDAAHESAARPHVDQPAVVLKRSA
jgi:hypothetical protein